MDKTIIDPTFLVVRKDFDTEHYYWIDEQYVPSVTSILGEAAPMGAGFRLWLLNNTPEEAEEIKNTTGAFGTLMHDTFQRLIMGDTIKMADFDKKGKKHLMTFSQWFTEFAPDPTSLQTEFTVGSKQYSYAGTLDLACMKNNERWIIDFKTTSGIYYSHELQVTAYKQAYEEMSNLKVDHTAILRTGTRHKIGYEFKEIDRPFEQYKNVYDTWLSLHDGKIPDPPIIDIYPEELCLFNKKK